MLMCAAFNVYLNLAAQRVEDNTVLTQGAVLQRPSSTQDEVTVLDIDYAATWLYWTTTWMVFRKLLTLCANMPPWLASELTQVRLKLWLSPRTLHSGRILKYLGRYS